MKLTTCGQYSTEKQMTFTPESGKVSRLPKNQQFVTKNPIFISHLKHECKNIRLFKVMKVN